MKKYLLTFLTALTASIGALYFIAQAAPVVPATGGGTGIGSATTSNVGQCLIVSSSNPFAYYFGTCGSGGVASTSPFTNGQIVVVSGTALSTNGFKTSDFLASATTYVSTVNNLSGAVSNVAFTNADNNFSTGQTVQGNVTTTDETITDNLMMTSSFGQIEFANTSSKLAIGANSASGQRQGSWATFFGTNNSTSGSTPPGGAEFVINSSATTTKFNILTYTGSVFKTDFSVDSNGNVNASGTLNASGTITQAGVPVLTTCTTSTAPVNVAFGSSTFTNTSTVGVSTTIFTIPGNTLTFGDYIDLKFSGSFLQNSGGSSQQNYGVELSGQNMFFTFTPANSANLGYYQADAIFQLGTSTATVNGQLTVNVTNGAGTISGGLIARKYFAIDMTQSQKLSIALWSATSTNQSMSLNQFTVIHGLGTVVTSCP